MTRRAASLACLLLAASHAYAVEAGRQMRYVPTDPRTAEYQLSLHSDDSISTWFLRKAPASEFPSRPKVPSSGSGAHDYGHFTSTSTFPTNAPSDSTNFVSFVVRREKGVGGKVTVQEDLVRLPVGVNVSNAVGRHVYSTEWTTNVYRPMLEPYASLSWALQEGYGALAERGISDASLDDLAKEAWLHDRVHDFRDARTTLLRYANTNLWLASYRDHSAIVTAAHDICGDSLVPTFITELTDQATNSFIAYVEASQFYAIPAEARVRVRLMGSDGFPVGQQEFSAGWRTAIRGFSTETSTDLVEKPDVLVIETGHGLTGRGTPMRQMYAVEFDRDSWQPVLSLVRFEWTNGSPVFINYWREQDHLLVGPWPVVPAADDTDAWIKRFRTGNTTQILSGLFFLCSLHSCEGRPEEALLARTIPAALRDKGILNVLGHHKSPWIREYVNYLNQKLEREELVWQRRKALEELESLKRKAFEELPYEWRRERDFMELVNRSSLIVGAFIESTWPRREGHGSWVVDRTTSKLRIAKIYKNDATDRRVDIGDAIVINDRDHYKRVRGGSKTNIFPTIWFLSPSKTTAFDVHDSRLWPMESGQGP